MNRIIGNGGHGIEFMGRFGQILRNFIQGNGFNLPGTSGNFKPCFFKQENRKQNRKINFSHCNWVFLLGIHIFSHGKGLDDQCCDNFVQVITNLTNPENEIIDWNRQPDRERERPTYKLNFSICVQVEIKLRFPAWNYSSLIF